MPPPISARTGNAISPENTTGGNEKLKDYGLFKASAARISAFKNFSLVCHHHGYRWRQVLPSRLTLKGPKESSSLAFLAKVSVTALQASPVQMMQPYRNPSPVHFVDHVGGLPA